MSDRGVLHKEPGILIAFDDQRRAIAPYFPVSHPDGSQNYGFIDLGGKPELVNNIPEAADSSAFQALLIAINEPNSPLTSIGCERAPSESSIAEIPYQVFSYTDVVFRDLDQNRSKANLIQLAHQIRVTFRNEVNDQAHVFPHEIELIVERLKLLHHIDDAWCLNLKIYAYGRTAIEALDCYEWTATRAANTILKLG